MQSLLDLTISHLIDASVSRLPNCSTGRCNHAQQIQPRRRRTASAPAGTLLQPSGQLRVCETRHHTSRPRICLRRSVLRTLVPERMASAHARAPALPTLQTLCDRFQTCKRQVSMECALLHRLMDEKRTAFLLMYLAMGRPVNQSLGMAVASGAGDMRTGSQCPP